MNLVLDIVDRTLMDAAVLVGGSGNDGVRNACSEITETSDDICACG